MMTILDWSQGITRWVANNDAIEAFANFFGVVAGLVIVYQVAKWVVTLSREVYRSSVRTTLRRRHFATYRKALVAAGDHVMFTSSALLILSEILAWLGASLLMPPPLGPICGGVAVFDSIRLALFSGRVRRVRRWLRRGLRWQAKNGIISQEERHQALRT